MLVSRVGSIVIFCQIMLFLRHTRAMVKNRVEKEPIKFIFHGFYIS